MIVENTGMKQVLIFAWLEHFCKQVYKLWCFHALSLFFIGSKECISMIKKKMLCRRNHSWEPCFLFDREQKSISHANNVCVSEGAILKYIEVICLKKWKERATLYSSISYDRNNMISIFQSLVSSEKTVQKSDK